MLFTCILIGFIFILYGKMKNEATWIGIWTSEKSPNIELTIRIPLQKRHLELVFCDLLRSVTLFWSSDWGDIVFILDEPDRKQDFESKLNNLQLPHKFRFVYEKLFNKESGRESMFYSSFIMMIVIWIECHV